MEATLSAFEKQPWKRLKLFSASYDVSLDSSAADKELYSRL